ncbi:MAG: chorismate mutase [Chloroflexota bacterium]
MTRDRSRAAADPAAVVPPGADAPLAATAAADPTAEALAPLRVRIDAIDHEIVALLNERAEIALEIGRVKEATGRRAIRDPEREAEVIERVTSASSGLFPEPELVSLYRTLIAATRKVQAEQRRRAKAARSAAEG